MHQIKVLTKTKSSGLVGILVTGVGLAVYLRRRLNNSACDSVLAECTAIDKSPASPLSHPNLQLKQVQVFFRHGARTPLYVLEGYSQAKYDVDFHMRPHQLTLFPYERVSDVNLKPVDWSSYEYHLRSRVPLRGGALQGQLTNFGQEQMYCLGLRLKECYGDELSLDSYHPDTTYLLSTNIQRTVESARCVMAGFFGKDQLKDFALKHGPVQMRMVDGKNILIPDTGRCKLLQDANHASMLHFDINSTMRENREKVEKHIDEQHDEHQLALTKAQGKLNDYFAALSEPLRKKSNLISFSSDRRLFNSDPVLNSLLKNRDLAIDQVDKFWQNVISNHPLFAGHLSKGEVRALAYLRKIEVEEFTLATSQGHRLILHFDPNPYFHNTSLCKEMISMPGSAANVSSKSTPIKWKEGTDLCQQHRSQLPDGKSSSTSFFCWYQDPVSIERDAIATAVREEIWKNPLDYYKHVSYAMDHSTTKKINFVYLRDDMVARETHGWGYPHDLFHLKGIPEKFATKMLYQAMTGRHRLERPVVTKLSIGRLLKDMVEKMEATLEGKSTTRLVLYSSHDSTMAPMLEALGLWDRLWPPFGCDVRLEVYQDKGDSKECYVRVLYKGQERKIRGQDRCLIRLSEFIAAIKPYIVDQENFDTICASSFLEEIAKDVLLHEEGEKQEDEDSIKTSETPAGM